MSTANGTPTEKKLRKCLQEARELRNELQSAKVDYEEATQRAESARAKLDKIGEEAKRVSQNMEEVLWAVRRESVIWAGLTSLVFWGVLWTVGAI